MISFIKGKLAEVFADNIVVESNNIGFNINVSNSLLSNLPAVGNEVKIYTYLSVREDAMSLYGFLSREDLNMFKLLIGVNGIGPKGALGVLSAITPDELRFAVLSGDAKTITKSPGIGNKTAQKLIIELKDKLSLDEAFEIRAENFAGNNSGGSGAVSEAVMALTSLGYSNGEALRAIKKIDINPEDTAEDILKQALKQLSFL